MAQEQQIDALVYDLYNFHLYNFTSNSIDIVDSSC